MKNNNKVVVVHLYGGVGNQLFQYTFGEYVRNKYQLNVLYDISSFGVLETFRNIQIQSITDNIPVFETNKYFFSRHTRFYRRFSRFLFSHKRGVIYCDNQIDEKLFYKDNWNLLYLDGYWHDRKYAEWVLNNIGNIYHPIDEVPACIKSYISFIQQNEVVSIHIRRGDYLNPINAKHLGVCTFEYFKQAVDVVKEKVSNPFFLFFSDDTDWVNENFHLGETMMVVDNNDIPPYWYIYLMSLCSHNIMSNSTFSWWGNFLNTNKNKVTVAPVRWFLDEKNPSFYSKQWILI